MSVHHVLKFFFRFQPTPLAKSLPESQLFGHEKDPSLELRPKRKVNSNWHPGATLFLDEVGELSLSTQARLLRALQEREIKRVGGTQPIRIDVRLIAATNRDADGDVTKGEFRRASMC